MNPNLESLLIKLARERAPKDDLSHDFLHVLRVLRMAKRVAKEYGADLDVIVPAALFHDIVMYPKNDPRSKRAAEESAEVAEEVLSAVEGYPKDKIPKVKEAIASHSYGHGKAPESLEAKILYDADKLEATGAIAIARVFASSQQMLRSFYEEKDPLAQHRERSRAYALDFLQELLEINNTLHTPLAKQIAERRRAFLKAFLDEFKQELEELG